MMRAATSSSANGGCRPWWANAAVAPLDIPLSLTSVIAGTGTETRGYFLPGFSKTGVRGALSAPGQSLFATEKMHSGRNQGLINVH
jgi:hypothetical protein